MKLRTDLQARDEQSAYLAEALRGLYSGPATPAPTVGGRQAALDRLSTFDPRPYAATRNHVTRRGVSALAPYIRHGVLSLRELRDYVLERYGHGPGTAKFISELAWRAFWQLVYADLGERIDQDVEPPKYAMARQPHLPADLAAGATGLACIDAALQELFATGYLHNHARMWIAAYLQHWRGVDWRAGAVLARAGCPFDASYEDLSRQLFGVDLEAWR